LTAVRYQATEDRQRLETILSRTYEGTQDCPALGGVRDPSDVVEGYLAVGLSAAAHWHVLQLDGADAGCLLLADHPQTEEFELVYVGLAPPYRGRGLGHQAVRHAQWLARVAGRKRLVLAVDATNAPAQAVYAATGFVRYDRRSVWVRVFSLGARSRACGRIRRPLSAQ
jgi:ribosomal protein S18 acetylase RimI-like enzyme